VTAWSRSLHGAAFRSLTFMDSLESQRVQSMVEGNVADKCIGGLERKFQKLCGNVLQVHDTFWLHYM